MKLNAEPTRATQSVNKPKASKEAVIPKGFRRLKWDEMVSVGDFVADEHRGLEPWAGPSGFRADSFEKPIYRLHASRVSATKKVK